MVNKTKNMSLTKSETETVEFIRLVSHVPLNQIHEVLKALASAICLKYASALQNQSFQDPEDENIIWDIPYIGKIVMKKNALLIDWQKHTLLLNELINVKRAVEHQDDSELLDSWYARVIEDLQTQLDSANTPTRKNNGKKETRN